MSELKIRVCRMCKESFTEDLCVKNKNLCFPCNRIYQKNRREELKIKSGKIYKTPVNKTIDMILKEFKPFISNCIPTITIEFDDINTVFDMFRQFTIKDRNSMGIKIESNIIYLY